MLSALLLCLLPVVLIAEESSQPAIPEPTTPVIPGPLPLPEPTPLPATTPASPAPAAGLAPYPLEKSTGPACPAPTTTHCADYTGLQGGATFYYLRPYFSNNVAYTLTSGLTTPDPSQSLHEFHWHFDPAVAAWIGWTSPSGLGARTRYFHYDESSSELTTSLTPAMAATTQITPPAGLANLPGSNFGTPGIVLGAGLGQANLTFRSDLKIDAWDIEGTWAWKCSNFSMLVSGGARYLHLSQSYLATLTNNTTVAGATVSELQQLRFTHNFEGAGPTLGWFGRYELGHTGIAVFGTARGALLVGTTHQDTSFFQNIVDPTGVVGGNQTLNPTRSGHLDQVVPVLELEVGLEYGLTLRNSRVFVRAGVVDHTYFDGGNASSTTGNFSLFGGTVSLGINY
jgi:hypothetical protein